MAVEKSCSDVDTDFKVEEKVKEKKSTNTVPIYKLFSFADSTDVILMMFGTMGAICGGLGIPLVTLLLGELVDSFGQNQNNKHLVCLVSKVALKYVYVAMGLGVAAFLQVACWMVTGERQTARIRNLYLKTILRQDVYFFDKETKTGEVVGRMPGDTVLIQDAVSEKVGKFTQLVSTFIGGFAIAFYRGWLLSLVMLCSIPPIVIVGGIMSLLMSRMASRRQNAYAEAANMVKTDNWLHQNSGIIFRSLGQASPCMRAFAAGQAAAFKMFETRNRKSEIDAYDSRGKVLDDIHGDIELRDVYFSYPTRPADQIFNGFSLSIPSGMTATLVGHSGSGKSTVFSLIERFYDPVAGEVLINGINIKEFKLRWSRGKIGLVRQEPVLFDASIKDNIAYGKDAATIDEIRAAAELAKHPLSRFQEYRIYYEFVFN